MVRSIFNLLYMESLTEIRIDCKDGAYTTPCPSKETSVFGKVKMVGSYECTGKCPFYAGHSNYADGTEIGVLCSNLKNQ